MINKKALLVLIAIVFAVVFSIFPWEEYRNTPFADRAVYLDNLLFGVSRLSYVQFGSLLDYVSNEWLWHYAMGELSFHGIAIESIFFAITFLCILVYSVYIVRFHAAWALIFLVNPLVVDFVFSQVRLACAIAILGLAFLFKQRKSVSLFLVLLTPFIHTAAVIFVFMYYFSVFLVSSFERRGLRAYWVYASLVGFGVAMSIVTGPLRELILSNLNDRRSNYNEDLSSTILYSSYWIVLLGIVGVRAIYYRFSPEAAFGVVILALVTTNAFVGGYSTRFLAASMPFLTATMLGVSGYWGVVTVGLYAVYVLAQWSYWLG